MQFMNKTILITGGSGFLGRHLAVKLKEQYHVVIGSRNNGINRRAEELTGCESVPLDITNINSIKDSFNTYKPDIVIHAAATKYVDTSEKFANECVDVNIVGSSNVARVSIDKGIETVIGISTDKAAPPVLNTYGISKALMERLFTSLDDQSSTRFTCVRFGNIVWSTGSVFPIWEQMISDYGLIKSTGPEMRRFFFTVNEASDLVIRSLVNIDILHGNILVQRMKCAQIKDLLDVFCEHYQTTWEQIKTRPGDKLDEYLIGVQEHEYAKELELDNSFHFLIDYGNKPENCVSKPFSSIDSKRLSKKEMSDLITSKSQLLL